MNIESFNPTTLPIAIPFQGSLSSEEISNFTQAVSNDLASMAELMNNTISKVLSTLPNDFDPDVSYLDGRFMYVDSSAAENKDAGFFWLKDGASSRPLTVYEAFSLFLKILASINNGLREYTKVGSIVSKVTVDIGAPVTKPWPYVDGMFKAVLFEMSGNDIIPADVIVSVNYNTKTLSIASTDTKEIWGYIWHPVFNI